LESRTERTQVTEGGQLDEQNTLSVRVVDGQEYGGEVNGRLGLALSPAELASSAVKASRERRDTEAILRAMREQTYQVRREPSSAIGMESIMSIIIV
jgi:hypothetical protein